MAAQVPKGFLFAPSMGAQGEAQSGYEGLLRGLGGLPRAILGASKLGAAGHAAYAARLDANRQRAEALGKLSSRFTYGGDKALTQIMTGQQPTSGGGKRGRGAAPGLAQALQATPIYEVEDEAQRLSKLATAITAAEAASRPQNRLEAALRPRPAYEEMGLANVPAQRLGLSERTIIRPSTITELSELIRSGDPSVASALSAVGLPADTSVEDLAGLGVAARDYQSEFASMIGAKQRERSKVNLAGRTVLMKSRLIQLGYDAENINDVAAELAKLPDDSAEAALAEMGRPTKFSHEIRKAKIQSVKRIINSYIYPGGKPGEGGGGPRTSGASTVVALQKEIAQQDKKISEHQARLGGKGQWAQFPDPGELGGTDYQAELDAAKERRQLLQNKLDRHLQIKSPGAINHYVAMRDAMWSDGETYAEALEALKAAGLPDEDALLLLSEMGNQSIRDVRGRWKDPSRSGVFTPEGKGVMPPGKEFTAWFESLPGPTDLPVRRRVKDEQTGEEKIVFGVPGAGGYEELGEGQRFTQSSFQQMLHDKAVLAMTAENPPSPGQFASLFAATMAKYGLDLDGMDDYARDKAIQIRNSRDEGTRTAETSGRYATEIPDIGAPIPGTRRPESMVEAGIEPRRPEAGGVSQPTMSRGERARLIEEIRTKGQVDLGEGLSPARNLREYADLQGINYKNLLYELQQEIPEDDEFTSDAVYDFSEAGRGPSGARRPGLADVERKREVRRTKRERERATENVRVREIVFDALDAQGSMERQREAPQKMGRSLAPYATTRGMTLGAQYRKANTRAKEALRRIGADTDYGREDSGWRIERSIEWADEQISKGEGDAKWKRRYLRDRYPDHF